MAALTHGKLVTVENYRQSYTPDSGFEAVCSIARQRRNLEFLQQYQPSVVLEVGSGAVLLRDLPGAGDLGFSRWIIVEPVPAYAAAAAAAVAHDPRMRVFEGFLEDRVADIAAVAEGGIDAVIISGVLSETTAPDALLQVAVSLLKPGGRLLASTPNALSFHRLLAVEAGLIASADTLSERNRKLGHPVVFDPEGLADLLVRNGLSDLSFDGFLFKPLTHEQMEAALDLSRADLMDGLIALGRKFPRNAAEICITAVKA